MPNLPRPLVLVLLLLPAMLSTAAGSASADTAVEALAAGNSLAAAGQLEEAVAAYRRADLAEGFHPTLAYNLGTTLHQLGQLPEAMLWYRRAAAGPDDDPWLADNMMLARRSLGSQTFGQRGPLDKLGNRQAEAAWVVAGLSWLAALCWWRRQRAAGAAALALALALGVATVFAARTKPEAAVLLRDCASAAGTLPAGSELWVLRTGSEWRVAGAGGATCPAESLELVFPAL